MPRDEELALPLMFPHQDANLLRVPTGRLELGLRVEILEQEPDRRLHAVAFELPQPDLVHHRGRERGLFLGHLGVGVGGEVADDLVARDAHAHGAADGLARHFARDHVWVAGDEAGEELEDGDLEVGRGVGVDAVVGFDDDEAAVFFGGGGEGGGSEATAVGGEGRGEAGRVEVAGVGGFLVDDAEVAEVLEHLGLSLRQFGFAVWKAEFKGAKHEEESKHVDFVHSQLAKKRQ